MNLLPKLCLRNHLNHFADLARMGMGLLDGDRALLGTNATSLAMIVIKAHHLAVVHCNGGIGADDPTEQALRALLQVAHGSHAAPSTSDISDRVA